MEPSRREFKIPLRVLCLLSYKIESRGPPGLRAELRSTPTCGDVFMKQEDSLRRTGRATSLKEEETVI